MELEKNVETDGSIYDVDSTEEETKGTSTTTDNRLRSKLPNGFGFTERTKHFRTGVEVSLPNTTDEHIELVKDEAVTQRVSSQSVQKETSTSVKSEWHKSEDQVNTDNRNEKDACTLPNKDTKSDIDEAEATEEGECITSCELDVIIRGVHEVVLQRQPSSVPYDYVDMSPAKLPTSEPKLTCLCMIPLGRKEPDESSDIKIQGDEFEATLCTFKQPGKNGGDYYRHFLVDVNPYGPAGDMKLEGSDELVLLNEVFVPELTHTEVLNRFQAVKIDGKSRFDLVIRRVQNKHVKKWVWIETSAILLPDQAIEDLHPVVRDLEYRSLSKEQIEVQKYKHLYKVPGTQKYLAISGGKVRIDIMKGDSSDQTKVIWKRTKYWEDDDNTGLIDFAAALSNSSEDRYIGIGQNNKIVLTDTPVWFKIVKIGSRIRFQLKNVYLGYDRESGEVEAGVSQCVFEELPCHIEAEQANIGSGYAAIDVNTDNIYDNTSDTTSIGSGSDHVIVHCDQKSISSSKLDITSIASSMSRSSVSSHRQQSVSSLSSQSSVESDRRIIESDDESISSSSVSINLKEKSKIHRRHLQDRNSPLTSLQSSMSSGYRSDINDKELDCS